MVSSTEVPPSTTFSVTSHSPYASIAQDDDGRWMFRGVLLACTEAVCQQLEAAQSYPGLVQLDFDHANSPAGPLDLIAVSMLPH